MLSRVQDNDLRGIDSNGINFNEEISLVKTLDLQPRYNFVSHRFIFWCMLYLCVLYCCVACSCVGDVVFAESS